MHTREVTSWIEQDTQTNATATATRTAPAEGLSHFITGISASFDAAATGVTLTLSDGATEVGRWYVHDAFALAFPSPVKLSPGTAANLAIAAGGSGVSGTVSMTGYTL